MDMNFPLLLGAAFSVSGVLLLRKAWQARRDGHASRRLALVTVAWTVTVLAFIPWMLAAGSDKGASFAVMAFMLAGAALVLREGFAHTGNGRSRKERDVRGNGDAAGNGRHLLLRRIGVFLLAGPAAAMAAIFLAATMFAAWDVETGSAANRLAAVMLFVPFAWSLLAIYATYDVRLRYRSLVVVLFLAAGVAGTFLSSSGVA